MADVFVSYSRRDAEFVRRLADSISERGKEVWLDTEGIADGEVFPEAIKRAIEQSDTFLFVITPDAVSSAYCENEVEYARDMQKRIVPVLREPVPDAELPAEIRDRNWIPFTEDAEFDQSMARLVTALDTDLEATKAHTRWLVKALEWDSEGQRQELPAARLGAEGRRGMARGQPRGRRPGADAASARVPARQPQRVRAPAASADGGQLGGRRGVDRAADLRADLPRPGDRLGAGGSERVGARSQALAAESQAQLPNDPEISVILGMRAVQTRATPQSLFALRAALDASPLERALPTIANPGGCLSAAISPDGREIAEGTCTGLVRILDAATGRVLRSNNIGVQVTSLAFSPDGDTLAAAAGNGVWVINPQTVAAVAWKGALSMGTTSVAFSPNGHTLAAGSGDGLAIGPVNGVAPGTELSAPLDGNVIFSPDGRLLFAGGQDASVHVYDAGTGRLIHRILAPARVTSSPEVVAVSPNGRQLAVAYPVSAQNATYAVSIYSTSTWREQSTLLTLPDVQITALAFSPDGSRLAIGAFDGTAGVWSIPTKQELVSYDGPTAAISSIDFTPDGNSVLTASGDGVARIWRAIGIEQSFQMLPLTGTPAQLAFDGNTLEAVPFEHPVVFAASAAGGHAVRRQTLPGVHAVVLSG